MTGSNSDRPARNPQPKSAISDLFKPGAPPITTKKQLQSMFSSLDLFDVFLAVLINHQASTTLVTELSNRVVELEEEIDDLKEKSRDLDDRLLRQEAYSGRNTIIVAGLPEIDTETPDSLEDNLVEMLKKSDPTITRQDIGIAHRNGKTKKPDTPGRSITCVLTRASKKDTLMRKDSRSKLKTDHDVMLFHRLSEGLRRRKKELEDLVCVRWVAFSGHRLFTVCVKKDDGKDNFIKNVLRTEDITEQNRTNLTTN
eukprot:sb/3468604/